MDNKLNSVDKNTAITEPAQNIFVQSKKWQIFKIVFLLLVFIVAAEIIWAARTLFTPVSKIQVNEIEPLSAARIILDSDKYEFQKGDTVGVKVKIATGGRQVDSIDLVLHFDPKILEAKTEAAFSKGQIFKDYPFVDIAKENGIIRVSALTPPNQNGFIGIGYFGTLNFKAVGTGQSMVSIEFKKGATVDSNVIETGTTKDILENVYDLNFAVGENLMVGQNSNPKVCDGYTQYCQDVSGKTGTQTCSSGVLENSSCVFDPKLTSSCTPCKSVAINK